MPPLSIASLLLFATVQNVAAQMAPSASAELGPPPQLSAGEESESPAIAPQATAAAVSVNPANRYGVSLLYRNTYAAEDTVTNGWAGTVTPCNGGATASAYQNATLERVNVFRTLAGLPGNVTAFTSPQQPDDQAAALMMVANKALSHAPPVGWICYTQAGYDGASHSNLTLGGSFNYNGPAAIEGYMDDSGNGNSFVGHRRWILYPAQANMATGDVDATVATAGYSANALWVVGPFGSRAATPNGTPWPPNGYVPWQLLPSSSNRWSFSFPGATFASAAVTMTKNGAPLTLSITENGAHDNLGYADNTLVWEPVGVSYSQPTQDVVYNVTITGITGGGAPASVSYIVKVINPYDAVFAGDFEN
jgi:hypothetical protein